MGDCYPLYFCAFSISFSTMVMGYYIYNNKKIQPLTDSCHPLKDTHFWMSALPSHLLTSHYLGYKKGSLNCDCAFITRNIYIYLEITWKWILCQSLPKFHCREFLNLLVYKKGSISMAKMKFSLLASFSLLWFPLLLVLTL